MHHQPEEAAAAAAASAADTAEALAGADESTAVARRLEPQSIAQV